MKRSLFVVAWLLVLLTAVMSSAGAAPITCRRHPAVGHGTGCGVLDKQLSLEGTMNGPLSSSNGGVEADRSNPPLQPLLDEVAPTRQRPRSPSPPKPRSRASMPSPWEA